MGRLADEDAAVPSIPRIPDHYPSISEYCAATQTWRAEAKAPLLIAVRTNVRKVHAIVERIYCFRFGRRRGNRAMFRADSRASDRIVRRHRLCRRLSMTDRSRPLRIRRPLREPNSRRRKGCRGEDFAHDVLHHAISRIEIGFVTPHYCRQSRWIAQRQSAIRVFFVVVIHRFCDNATHARKLVSFSCKPICLLASQLFLAIPN
jgi:hypothetical protein